VTTWLPAGTSKSIHLVRLAGAGPEATEGLLGESLRAALAAAGVRRLQVNRGDEQVAGAMGFPSGLGDPVVAMVSTWAGDPAATVAAVREAVPGAVVDGWAVDERRRLDPDETYAGERADALANVAVLRRPAELDHATWLHRWMIDHTAIAIRTQATTGYVQNLCLHPLTDDPTPVDAVVEELFPVAGITDPHAFYGSGGDDEELGRRMDELMGSVTRIGADRDLDLVPTGRHLWDLADE